MADANRLLPSESGHRGCESRGDLASDLVLRSIRVNHAQRGAAPACFQAKPRVDRRQVIAPPRFQPIELPAKPTPGDVGIEVQQKHMIGSQPRRGDLAHTANRFEVNRAGVRIIAISNTTTSRSAARTAPQATVAEVPSVDEMTALAQKGEGDAFALTHDSFAGLLPKLPGARVLPGYFQQTGIAVAVVGLPAGDGSTARRPVSWRACGLQA